MTTPRVAFVRSVREFVAISDRHPAWHGHWSVAHDAGMLPAEQVEAMGDKARRQGDAENNSDAGAFCPGRRAPDSDDGENLPDVRAFCSDGGDRSSDVDENLSNARAFCSGRGAPGSGDGENLSDVEVFCSACEAKSSVSVDNLACRRFHGVAGP